MKLENILIRIEELRKELEEIKSNKNTFSKEVIKKSQELDRLIVKYMRLKYGKIEK